MNQKLVNKQSIFNIVAGVTWAAVRATSMAMATRLARVHNESDTDGNKVTELNISVRSIYCMEYE